MSGPATTPLDPKKLLLSKWTAGNPRNKEKHFLVARVLQPAAPAGKIAQIELEAVHSKRVTTLHWRELTDRRRWLPGWL
jgi:tryptophan-rich hypothetical protein